VAPEKAAGPPKVQPWRGLELLEPLKGGVRNHVFRARRGREDLVVRTSKRPDPSLAWELDLLDHLQGAGIPVPITIPTDDGRLVADGVLVQRFLPGGPPVSTTDWQRVIAVLRVIHDVTAGWPQRPGFASARTLLTQDQGGDVDLSAMPEPAARLVRAGWRPVLHGRECVIHGDLGAGNLLLTEDQVALIDWDEARVDVPAFDYAHLPPEVSVPVNVPRDQLVTAGVAWEAATCWVVEPAYAQTRLTELRSRLPPS
jgi:Ser/Thr protein kinase RdoA (MazF antagonist)